MTAYALRHNANPGHLPGILIDLADRPSAGQIDEKLAKSVENLQQLKLCTGG
jgi:hypothetical protein